MAETVALRTGWDRIRYAVAFEGLLLVFLVPIGALVFDRPLSDIGALGVILSLMAMALNLIYNGLFDWFDARAGRVSSERSHPWRLAHAVGFEVTLTLSSLPVYLWWLQIGLIEALVTDITAAGLVVGYTYVFTLVYDRLFPLPTA